MTTELTPIKVAVIEFRIIGLSPLIQNAWDEKALEMLRMTAMERKKRKKEPRDPEASAAAKAHRTAEGKYGIPLLAFKASLIGAAHKNFGIEKTMVRKAFFIADPDGIGIIPMECREPIVREDVVRVGMGATDLRYRPEFREWAVDITADIDAEILNEGDVVNLVNRAGFGVGIGEWRPEKGGDFGRYKIDPDADITVTDK